MNFLQNRKDKLLTQLKSHILILKIITFFDNNPLYNGVLVLGSGAAFAQVIGLFTMPIITRLYSPSDLGILTIYASILSLIVIVSSLRYEMAYPLPVKIQEITNLLALCLLLILGTSIVFTLFLIFAGESLVKMFNMRPLKPFIWLLPIGYFGTGLYSTLSYWAIRQRKYNKITHTLINQSICGSLMKIILGLLSCGPTGLIIGHLVSQMAGISVFVRDMWNTEWNNIKYISFKGVKSVAKKYWTFPIFNLPSSFLNTLSLQLPPIVLLFLYDTQIVGFYALAHMLLITPGNAIKTSVGQVFFGEASKMYREGSLEFKTLYIKTAKHLTFLALFFVGIPVIFAPFLIPLIFGEVWAEAGLYTLPLAFMMISAFIVSPITRLDMLGYNKWLILWDTTRVLGVIFGFYISYLLDLAIVPTLIIYSAIVSFMYILLMVINLKSIDNYTKALLSF